MDGGGVRQNDSLEQVHRDVIRIFNLGVGYFLRSEIYGDLRSDLQGARDQLPEVNGQPYMSVSSQFVRDSEKIAALLAERARRDGDRVGEEMGFTMVNALCSSYRVFASQSEIHRGLLQRAGFTSEHILELDMFNLKGSQQ